MKYRSQTCPQCRSICNQDQIKRIYIDFASDEYFACMQTLASAPTPETYSEETIKLLLEHIDTLPEKKDKRDDECEFCKSILEAFDDLQDKKEFIELDLNNKTTECANLIAQNNNALKCIEELQIKIRASEHNLSDLNERLDASEKLTAALHSENLLKDDIIRENNIEGKIIRQQLHELTVRLKEIINKHTVMWQIFQNNFKMNWPSKLLNMYRISQGINWPHANEKIGCQAIAPFCGNIENWQYEHIMIPMIKLKH